MDDDPDGPFGTRCFPLTLSEASTEESVRMSRQSRAARFIRAEEKSAGAIISIRAR